MFINTARYDDYLTAAVRENESVLKRKHESNGK